MGIPLFDQIEKLINEHGSATILRERLGLAADQYAALTRKNGELTERQAESDAQIKDLQARLQEAEAKIQVLSQQEGEFIAHCGVQWKKDGSGGFEPFPYCPTCNGVLSGFPPSSPDVWFCDNPCDRTYPHSSPPPKPKGQSPIAINRTVRRS